MRNLKKLFAVIMTVAMLASVMVPALAAEGFKYEAEAQKLYDLGLFQGNSATSYVPDLGTTLNRQAGLALAIRLMGKDAAVAALTQEEIATQLAKIVDADEITDWAKPYAAYAVKNGLTNGIDASILPNVKFGAQLDLTGKEFINFVLKAMGYQAAWDDVLTKAAEIGMLSAGDAVTFGTTPVLNRDAAVGVMASALSGKTSAGVTLAQALVDAGAVSAEAMATAGYFAPTATPTPVPVDLAIDSTVGDNLKVVVVNFNKEFDKDTMVAANVTVSENGTLGEVKYSDDHKTAYIVLTNAVAQNAKVKVKFKDIKDVAGNKMAETTVETYMKDLAVPEILGATVIDAKTIEISVSEPINYIKPTNTVLNDIKIDGLAPVATTAYDVVKNILTINLSNKMAVGTHTLTIKSMKDFNNLIAVDKEFSIAVGEDSTAPAIESATIKDKNTIEIIFNEKLSKMGSIKIDGTDRTGASVWDNAKKVTVTVPDLGIGAVLEVKIEYKDQEDVVGNKVADWTSFKTNVADDTALPEVAMTQDGSKLVFTFTKKMNTTAGKVTIKKASDDSTAATVNASAAVAVWDTDKKVMKIDTADVTVLGKVDAGSYKAVVESFKDATIRSNELAKVTLEFTSKDSKDPTVVATYLVKDDANDDKKDTITFYFSEAMDEATLNNLSNYVAEFAVNAITNQPFSAITDVKVKEIADGGKSVVIYYPGAGAFVGQTFRIGALKDLAGNYVATTSGIAKLANTTMTVADVKATAANKVEVWFNNEIKTADPSAFKIQEAGVDYAGMIDYAIKNDDSAAAPGTKYKVTFTLSKDLGSDTTKYALVVNSASQVENIYGTKYDLASGVVVSAAIPDGVRPTIKEVKAADAQVVNVTVSEAVYCANVNDLFNSMIIKDKDGNVLDAGDVGAGLTILSIAYKFGDVDATLASGFDKIVITFNANHKNKNVSFAFIARNVTDKAGNLITAKAEESITIKE